MWALTGILDVQLAATVSTPQQTHKERLTGAYSATHRITTRHAVVRDQSLNALIFLPRDVPFMMIGDQYTPVRWCSLLRARHLLASLRKIHLRSGPAISVGAGVYRILQQAKQRVITGYPPAHLVSRAVYGSRKLDLLCAEPEEKAARAAKLVELAKHELNRFAHPRIRSLFKTSIGRAHVTNSNVLDQMARLLRARNR